MHGRSAPPPSGPLACRGLHSQPQSRQAGFQKERNTSWNTATTAHRPCIGGSYRAVLAPRDGVRAARRRAAPLHAGSGGPARGSAHHQPHHGCLQLGVVAFLRGLVGGPAGAIRWLAGAWHAVPASPCMGGRQRAPAPPCSQALHGSTLMEQQQRGLPAHGCTRRCKLDWNRLAAAQPAHPPTCAWPRQGAQQPTGWRKSHGANARQPCGSTSRPPTCAWLRRMSSSSCITLNRSFRSCTRPWIPR